MSWRGRAVVFSFLRFPGNRWGVVNDGGGRAWGVCAALVVGSEGWLCCAVLCCAVLCCFAGGAVRGWMDGRGGGVSGGRFVDFTYLAVWIA
jgi:hypothetical protein